MNIFNKEMNDRLKSGETVKIGIEGNFDNEVIMSVNPDVIFISPFKRGGYDAMREVGIPLVPHLGYKEMTPLGQAEWIKFIERTPCAELQRRKADGRQGFQGQRRASGACGVG